MNPSRRTGSEPAASRQSEDLRNSEEGRPDAAAAPDCARRAAATYRDPRREVAGTRTELAAAIRRVNARYSAVPQSRWPAVHDEAWRKLERELDAALAAGDRPRALAAIGDWERWALEALEAG